MNESPFVYGKTVSKHAFTNRLQECRKLESNLLQGVNTAIISPRRWGKSSLVEKVVGDIKAGRSQRNIAMIDLFTVSTEEEFLEAYAREVLKASSKKWQEWLSYAKELFKRLIPKINVGVDPQHDFSLSFDWQELKKHREEILNLPESLANKKGVPFLICLDEFQNIATFKGFESLEKTMRAVWQRQKMVTYCLYGSKRHMMEEIFDNSSKPFYRFGDIIQLGKITSEDWKAFIPDSFRKSGKGIRAEIAEMIPQLMNNHPWYVQQLCHYTWLKTNKIAEKEHLRRALEELIRANIPFYQREVEGLSRTQLNLLKAIGRGELQLTSSRVMQDYKLGTPRNVSKNKGVLMREDIIHKTPDGLEFLDPAFKLWFDDIFLDRRFSL